MKFLAVFFLLSSSILLISNPSQVFAQQTYTCNYEPSTGNCVVGIDNCRPGETIANCSQWNNDPFGCSYAENSNDTFHVCEQVPPSNSPLPSGATAPPTNSPLPPGGTTCDIGRCTTNSDCAAGTTCQGILSGVSCSGTCQGPRPTASTSTCDINTGNPDPEGEGIYTAIGCIPYEPVGLTRFFLGWALGIGGGLALLMIGWAAIIIMTSSGDPKKVQGGKELLTAAISGLLLIIFSTFILRFFGVTLFNIF